jgi:hypothetical protein
MATLITKNSSTATSVPSAGSLVQGELAVNVTDKKLYSKDSGGAVVKLVGGLGNQEANAAAITGGSINGTTVGASTASTGAFTTLSASSTVSGTGFSTYLASPPAIGGTAAAAGAFTTLAASGAVTLSGGTANGVAYLNGSKVVTSGSALTYNGTNLSVDAAGAGPAYLEVSQRSRFGYDGTNVFISDAGTGKDIVFTRISEQMRLTSTGLGIGTSSFSNAKLVVSGTSAGTVGAIMSVDTASTTSFLRMVADLGSQNLINWQDGTALRFATSTQAYGTFNERMRLDSSGNLGLGVTPSAWSYRSLSVGTAGTSIWQTGSDFGLSSNAYNNGGWKYNTTGGASLYDLAGNQHIWYNAPSGTAGSTITFTQAATLTAGGNYLVGDTSDYLASRIYAKTTTTDNSTNALSLRNSASTELFRVRSDGYIYAGFYPQTTASAANVTIASGGDLLRSTSALKYKQDIRDIEEMDIDLLRPVRYKSKCANDDQTKDHLGLIADEAAEAGFEELVIRGADGEVEGFQYERLTVVLLKTVQSLRQRVAALEA